MRSNENKHFIITGEVHEGKTTFAFNVLHELQKRGISVYGFLCPGKFVNSERNSFQLYDIQANNHIELAITEFKANWHKFKRFYFNPTALKRGNEILCAVPDKRNTVTMIDEVGPMELKGEGWHCGMQELAKKKEVTKTIVVRKNILQPVMSKYGLDSSTVLDVSESKTAEFVHSIFKNLHANR